MNAEGSCLSRLALVGALALTSCGESLVLEDHAVGLSPASADVSPSAPCANRNPLRDAFFGDLHVHTTLSSDARNYDVMVDPDDAYRYAFGEAIGLPPLDASGNATRQVHIDRPLDFAAVTDHAEFLGETVMCDDPASEVYETATCQDIRDSTTPVDSPLAFQIMNPLPWRADEVCEDDNSRCNRANERAWQQTIRAAESWNDTSARCARTAFIAYEYSSFRMGSNLHRNVIFRNSTVPGRPISYMDVQREWTLWRLLEETCLDSRTTPGAECDVLAIPHNSNISNGRMFAVDYPGTSSDEEQADRARLRMRIEPIVEVMQHKGDSECRRSIPGVLGGEDELCDFEKFENNAFRRMGGDDPGECYEGPLADLVPRLGPSCLSRLSYTRYALTEGLAEEARIGVNPFKFGLMASTDTHNALAGGVEERSWPGHLGIADDTVAKRVTLEPTSYGNTANGPGGLIGVWAEENSRDSLFDAMRRKEVFGTSGPRIRPRLFGGWDLDPSLCSDPNAIEAAYASGVPMGGDLSAQRDGGAPRFLTLAHRDPGTEEAPGGLLQRIQVIKGWVDEAGTPHQQVFDVAGGENGANVDPATCAPRGTGHETLCTVWTDPAFDPERRAVYYARVVENPSCRYSAWQCLGLTGEERPADCDSPDLERVIQERAWTSPIWYTPAG